jgi:hypothetical protein
MGMRLVYSKFARANSLDWPGDMMIVLDEFQQSTFIADNVTCGRDRGRQNRDRGQEGKARHV